VRERYRKPEDLPERVALFPLRGVILLPGSTLPLNVFEPRYLQLVDDALAADRLIGIIQPHRRAGDTESPEGKEVRLRPVGTVGRLTTFSETEDGRYLITLTGIARFALGAEETTETPYRVARGDFSRFAGDLVHGQGEEDVDRDRLLTVLKTYLEVNKLSADWDSINRSSNELLVNTLSMISPYGPEEKQALLEAENLKKRAEVLVALAEMELATRDDGSGSTLQ
jgi:Lon protease-like protein